MQKFAFFSLLLILLCSCKAGKNNGSVKLQPITKDINASFQNYSFKSKGRNYTIPSLLELFEIPANNPDSISLKFTVLDELEVSYKDDSILYLKTFKGRFRKKGYYDFYIRNNRILIPPVVPFLYSKMDVYRIRLCLTQNGDLFIDNSWIYGGNIFILGAGDSGNRQNYFRKIH